MRPARTCARSYCACWTSQLSALPPKTLDKRTAISGDMPRFPFTSSESVFRETPSASAACVMVNSNGSMHSCRTTVPGCGGFFICMGGSVVLVVIDIVNILYAAVVKTENHTPVSANNDGIKAFQIAF